MENRQQRLNLRLVGLPENTEKGDLVSFLNEWLPELLGPENFPTPTSVDQAFRLPKAATSNVNKPNLKPVPRVILVKLADPQRPGDEGCLQEEITTVQGESCDVFP